MHNLCWPTQTAQGVQATRQLDLWHFPQVLAFECFSPILSELVAKPLEYNGSLDIHTAKPALIVTDEQFATLETFQGACMVAVVTEKIVQIEVVHLVYFADHF